MKRWATSIEPMTANPIENAKVTAMVKTLVPGIGCAPGVIVMTAMLISMTATIVIAHLSGPKLGIGCDASNPILKSR